MTPLFLVVLVLGAYRLTRALTIDAIADPIRTRVVARYGTKGLGMLIDCPFCAGWWISGLLLAVAVAVVAPLQHTAVVFWWPAIAGGQAMLACLDKWLTT